VGDPWSNQQVSLIVLTEETTGFSGLFGYSPTVGTGNLIFSVAARAGTDPYGNAYPQGLSITLGSISGATISGSTFEGTDFIINSSGEFFYSGTPAAGNLVESVAPSAGSDAFGNKYLAGQATYGSGFATTLAAGFVAFYTGSLTAGWTFQAQIETDSGGDLILTPGAAGTIELAGTTTFGGNMTVYPYNLDLDMGVPTGYSYTGITVATPGGANAAYYSNVTAAINALVTGLNALIAEMINRELIA
jgi:hypothetical protein